MFVLLHGGMYVLQNISMVALFVASGIYREIPILIPFGILLTVAGMFNTASPVNNSQTSNNNGRSTQQVETGGIITLKPNKQRTHGKKKFCSLL